MLFDFQIYTEFEAKSLDPSKEQAGCVFDGCKNGVDDTALAITSTKMITRSTLADVVIDSGLITSPVDRAKLLVH